MERVPISVFMIKPSASAIHPSSPALSAFDSNELAERPIEIGEMRGKIWLGASPDSPPDWVKHFGPFAGLNPNHFTASSVQGAIALPCDGAEFLLTFGHAWRRVRTSRIVPNFGLRCALNLCRANDLRANKHDRIAHDYVQTMVQSPEEADIYRFGIDIEQDLLRGVRAAVSKEHGFGSSVTGADAFKFSYDPADSLDSTLRKVRDAYQKTDYRSKFSWVDDISPVRDEGLQNTLIDALSSQINSDPAPVTLCLPDFEGWDSYDQYSFGRAYRNQVRSTLSLSSWLHHLRGDGIAGVTANLLRTQKVHAHHSSDIGIKRTWTAIECMHAVLDTPDGRFLIHGGEWFQLGQGYLERIERQLTTYFGSSPAVSLPMSTADEKEGDYNIRIARGSQRQLFLLDKRLISHGGGRSRIEVCDLLSTSLHLVCVKRWCGSAGISHLCNQAINSARLVRSDLDFCSKVDKKLKGIHRAAWARLRSNRAEPEVVFAVMGGGCMSSFPLFSRMSLLNAAKQIKAMGFKVSHTSV